MISHEALKQDFRYFIKQKGGMLAKGRLLGIQFDTLFTENLYMDISAHAISLAEKLRAAIDEKGYPYLVPNRTNQIFPIMPDSVIEKLNGKFSYSYERRVDETHSAIRFCTSWATKEENVDALIQAIKDL